MPNRRRTGPGRRPSRGRTLIWERSRAAPSLKKLPDQGGEAELSYDEVGGPDRPDWIDSFLTANRDALARLAIATSVRVKEGRALVVLTSSDRLGAIPQVRARLPAASWLNRGLGGRRSAKSSGRSGSVSSQRSEDLPWSLVPLAKFRLGSWPVLSSRGLLL